MRYLHFGIQASKENLSHSFDSRGLNVNRKQIQGVKIMVAPNTIIPVKAVLFDFGGVVAEEGFRKGFEAIAAENGLDPIFLYTLAVEAVFESGYITLDVQVF